jgi:hypothetical protein
MSSRFHYRGSLAETPLPKMLAVVHHYRVPGVLSAERPGQVTKIFLDDGKVVFATSSDLDDALGAFLVRRGTITPDQLDESTRRIGETGRRQGEVLIEMGVLTPAQMAEAVISQVSAILWSVFAWEEGEVTFEVGRFRAQEKIRIDLPIARVIREGLMEHADPRVLVKRIGPSWTVLEPMPGVVPGIPLDTEETQYLALVDGHVPFGDLCRKGPADAATNARILYLLFCLDLIRRKADPAARKIQWRTSGGALGR